MAAGEAKLVGAGHQLLDQSAFADTGRPADYHGARKCLGGLYDFWGCCHLLSGRGSLRALSCAHAVDKSAQVPQGHKPGRDKTNVVAGFIKFPSVRMLVSRGCAQASMHAITCEKPKRGAKGQKQSLVRIARKGTDQTPSRHADALFTALDVIEGTATKCIQHTNLPAGCCKLCKKLCRLSACRGRLTGPCRRRSRARSEKRRDHRQLPVAIKQTWLPLLQGACVHLASCNRMASCKTTTTAAQHTVGPSSSLP